MVADAVSQNHTKMKFDDTAVVDFAIPGGATNAVTGSGVASGDEYWQVGGYNRGGNVYKFRESDNASYVQHSNPMADRQMHATIGAY